MYQYYSVHPFYFNLELEKRHRHSFYGTDFSEIMIDLRCTNIHG